MEPRPALRPRSGKAAVEVDGWIRLGIELVVLVAGAAAIWFSGRPGLATAYSILVAAQYLTSLGRIGWLIEQ
jgi:hypothetical protein